MAQWRIARWNPAPYPRFPKISIHINGVDAARFKVEQAAEGWKQEYVQYLAAVCGIPARLFEDTYRTFVER